MTRLYVVILCALAPGEALAQAAHAVAEVHAALPSECARWRAESNTVVVLNAPARVL